MFDPPQITSRSLFHASGDPHRDVIIGAAEPDWYRFAYGYKAAADLLIARLNERGVAVESVCLPILFLYRHYVELMLKALLRDLGDLSDSIEQASGSHALVPLWANLSRRLLAYDPRQDSPWLDRAAALIAELDRLDHGSFSFRYPVAKDGTRLVNFGETLDIRNFSDVMRELALVLDGAAAMFEEHLHLRRDLEDEFDYHLYYSY